MILTYSVSSDIISGKVDIQRLSLELVATIGDKFDFINNPSDDLEINFKSDLLVGEVTVLNSVVSNHSGVNIPYVDFYVATKVIQDESIITQQNEWQVLSGVLSRPAFFASDITKSFSVFSGLIKYEGSGLEVRMVQIKKPSEEESIVGLLSHEEFEESHKFHLFSMKSDFLDTDDECVYQIEARLNGSDSASMKFCTQTLMELK